MNDSKLSNQWIYPQWNAPSNVTGVFTTRFHGVSKTPYDSFNLGIHVGDEIEKVKENRKLLEKTILSKPVWLTQVHGTKVVEITGKETHPIEADASICRIPGFASVVMVADCLPVLLCDTRGTVVAAAHAGWRGLVEGIIGKTIDKMHVSPTEIIAALGPCIGSECFEVGAEVRERFLKTDNNNTNFFHYEQNHWFCDLQGIASLQLKKLKVKNISVSSFCTKCDSRFYSYRQNKVTGRFAGLIWIER